MKTINKNVEMFCQNISANKNKKAFTLVELIIVITILAILATIAFVSFQNFTKDSRDGNRITTLKNIESWLSLYNIKSSNYPDPDELVEILWTWNILLSKQWIVWNDIAQKIKLNKEAKDPKDKTNYIYSITWNGKKYQLWTYLEENKLITYLPQITKTYAINVNNIDYTNRYFYTIWNKVWILLEDETNQVITKEKYWTWTLDLTDENNETKNFKVYFSNDTESGSYTSSWTNLITTIVEEQKTTQTIKTPIQEEDEEETPTYSCIWALVTANADITNTTWLTVDTPYQTSNSSNSCYYTCKTWYWEENCQTNLNVMNKNTCQTLAWWWWVPANEDTQWDGFCISPRMLSLSTNSIWQWVSWNWYGDNTWWDYNWFTQRSNTEWSAWQYGSTWELPAYECTPLWNATTHFDTTDWNGDTLVNRMKWMKASLVNTQVWSINWITGTFKPTNHPSIPAIIVADCIDWVRDLWPWKPDLWWISWTNYTSTTNDNTIRDNRNTYLQAWTTQTSSSRANSHLPSAYSSFNSSTSYTSSFTWNNRGEYQVACDYFKTWAWNDTIWGTNTDFASDQSSSKWIWLSSVGGTGGSHWGRSARLVGPHGCGGQYNSDAGPRTGTLSARFVVR